jgi:hypothetical protein
VLYHVCWCINAYVQPHLRKLRRKSVQQTPPTPASITDQEAQCYLNRYPDLQVSFGATNIAAAKTHWIQNGRNEGRDMTCPPTTLTDQEAQCYLSRYPDLVAAFGATNIQAAKNHWNANGRSESYWYHPDYSCPVPITATPSSNPTVIRVCLCIYVHTHTHTHTATYLKSVVEDFRHLKSATTDT